MSLMTETEAVISLRLKGYQIETGWKSNLWKITTPFNPEEPIHVKSVVRYHLDYYGQYPEYPPRDLG